MNLGLFVCLFVCLSMRIAKKTIARIELIFLHEKVYQWLSLR